MKTVSFAGSCDHEKKGLWITEERALTADGDLIVRLMFTCGTCWQWWIRQLVYTHFEPDAETRLRIRAQIEAAIAKGDGEPPSKPKNRRIVKRARP